MSSFSFLVLMSPFKGMERHDFRRKAIPWIVRFVVAVLVIAFCAHQAMKDGPHGYIETDGGAKGSSVTAPDEDESSTCPGEVDDEGADTDHHYHHHHGDSDKQDQSTSRSSNRINRDNYREWIGEYTNKKGQIVEVPLVVLGGNGTIALLTPLNFLSFTSGQMASQQAHRQTADGKHVDPSSPANEAAEDDNPTPDHFVTITFWMKPRCGGLCEDAMEDFNTLAQRWQNTSAKSRLARKGTVVQFAVYEVQDDDRDDPDVDEIRKRSGPNGSPVFDYPTMTVTLRHSAEAGKKFKVKPPSAYHGALCSKSLCQLNVVSALSGAAVLPQKDIEPICTDLVDDCSDVKRSIFDDGVLAL